MSTYTILDTTLTSIADAVRDKAGTTDLIKVSELADAIANIPTGGGGGGGDMEPITLTGNMGYFNYNGNWSWVLEKYGDLITTQDINNIGNAFSNVKNLEYIPFKINGAGPASNAFGSSLLKEIDLSNYTLRVSSGTSGNDSNACTNVFYLASGVEKISNLTYDDNEKKNTSSYSQFFRGCSKLTEIGDLINFRPNNLSSMFADCYRLKQLPNFVNWDWDYFHNNKQTCSGVFSACYSLREIPVELLKELYSLNTSSYSNLYYYFINSCYSLDKIEGISVLQGTLTSNCFTTTFSDCHRLSDVIFETNEDGTPKTANWKNQTIGLYSRVGFIDYEGYRGHVLNYNSGITADKEVIDDATYQALKDDPDWWANAVAYSRYNHDSAVRTINSLPDTSAYLAANGGTNTIQFKGKAGELTDGGAINTLTEEEIAVATAKGWTVTFIS